jgi:hypothetical protein
MDANTKGFHTFGDSHSRFAWDHIPGVATHHIGPLLCYSFGKDPSRINVADPKYEVKDGDSVCFCLGEIDCRNHLYKHTTPQRASVDIEAIVSAYMDAIKVACSPFKDLRVYVYSVTPTVRMTKESGYPRNREYPHLGDNNTRNLFTYLFNHHLREQCPRNGYVMVDVYDKYKDNDGYIKYELSDGSVHINNPVHIREFLHI